MRFLTLFPTRSRFCSVSLSAPVCVFFVHCFVVVFYFIVSLLYFNEVKLVSLYGSLSFDLYQYENVVSPWNYSRLNLFFLYEKKNTNKLNWKKCGDGIKEWGGWMSDKRWAKWKSNWNERGKWMKFFHVYLQRRPIYSLHICVHIRILLITLLLFFEMKAPSTYYTFFFILAHKNIASSPISQVA